MFRKKPKFIFLLNYIVLSFALSACLQNSLLDNGANIVPGFDGGFQGDFRGGDTGDGNQRMSDGSSTYGLSGQSIGLSSSTRIRLMSQHESLELDSNQTFQLTHKYVQGEAYNVQIQVLSGEQQCFLIKAKGQFSEVDMSDLKVFCSDFFNINESWVQGFANGARFEDAAVSCHWLKAVYPELTSGLYWLDIDGPKNNRTNELGFDAFKGYCDMESSGGGWLLINKSNFTHEGPNKVEMTGDMSLVETTDPWSGGALVQSLYIEADKFYKSENPKYFPEGFLSNALHSPSNNLNTTESFAIINRNIIELIRSQHYTSRAQSVLMQVQGNRKRYVQSQKRFNPIQHKCENTTAQCMDADDEGCAEDFISANEVYLSYDSNAHKAMSAMSRMSDYRSECHIFNSGFQGVILGWGANTPGISRENESSGFYYLGRTGTQSRSDKGNGPLTEMAPRDGGLGSRFCGDERDCSYTTLWLK